MINTIISKIHGLEIENKLSPDCVIVILHFIQTQIWT